MDNVEASLEIRNRTAEQIKIGRAYDTNLEDKNRYIDKRELGDFINNMRGISNFLSYVREHKLALGSNFVLDIGTGDGLAATQLLQSGLSEGLQIEGTTLKLNTRIKKNLGDRFHITPVETLYGIKDSSVAAIISNFGISYSLAPRMAAEAIDRVMVPSGILKATFGYREKENTQQIHPRSPGKMTEALRSLGWKVEIYDIDKGHYIMLASKPPVLIDLDKLAEKDKGSFYKQIMDVRSEKELAL